MERGKARNKDHTTQERDYSGLRFGNITPTDLDGMIEYHNIGYVYLEYKFQDADLPHGQALALERQCDDMSKVKPVLGIIASHTNLPEEPIDGANAIVSRFRFNHKWTMPMTTTTTKELVGRFLHWLDFEKDNK
jgi:hypothetical protein